MNVLLVEDDKRLSEALSHILSENGYTVEAVYDGRAGLEYAQTGNYDVVILDVMLPEMDGLEVVASLRRKHVSTPVLLLTARDTTADKITGFDSGADDYMTKPFSPAELMAHLRALTRRQGDVVFENLEKGDLVLNLDQHVLKRGSHDVSLSMKEFELARLLLTHMGQIVSKETISRRVWGLYAQVEDNNIEAYVSLLRKKLKFLESAVKIETVRGAGYKMVFDQEEA